VKHLFAHGAYDDLNPMDKTCYPDFVIDLICYNDNQPGSRDRPVAG
jgi:hypothetical protein